MPKLLDVLLVSGTGAGTRVYIPRISLAPKNPDLPFVLSRRQFPVKLAWAMTFNKAQGQTLTHVGLYLQTMIFSHGQLYVGLSRAGAMHRVKVLVLDQEGGFLVREDGDTHGAAGTYTANVVWPEALLPDTDDIQAARKSSVLHSASVPASDPLPRESAGARASTAVSVKRLTGKQPPTIPRASFVQVSKEPASDNLDPTVHAELHVSSVSAIVPVPGSSVTARSSVAASVKGLAARPPPTIPRASSVQLSTEATPPQMPSAMDDEETWDLLSGAPRTPPLYSAIPSKPPSLQEDDAVEFGQVPPQVATSSVVMTEVIADDDTLTSDEEQDIVVVDYPDEVFLREAKVAASRLGVRESEWYEVSSRTRREIEFFLEALQYSSVRSTGASGSGAANASGAEFGCVFFRRC